MHQRFITGLSEQIATMNDERYEVGEADITESLPTDNPELKSGIPKYFSGWNCLWITMILMM